MTLARSGIRSGHVTFQQVTRSNLESPGRSRALLPVRSLVHLPSPSDTGVTLTEATQSDGACAGRYLKTDKQRMNTQTDRTGQPGQGPGPDRPHLGLVTDHELVIHG